mmetsp:Transcript_219/g.229  ORF Transcript_219/g.229 Transcript_219/m.229 type:complete len:113 (-) Transcript_219:14-352(-)
MTTITTRGSSRSSDSRSNSTIPHVILMFRKTIKNAVTVVVVFPFFVVFLHRGRRVSFGSFGTNHPTIQYQYRRHHPRRVLLFNSTTTYVCVKQVKGKVGVASDVDSLGFWID